MARGADEEKSTSKNRRRTLARIARSFISIIGWEEPIGIGTILTIENPSASLLA